MANPTPHLVSKLCVLVVAMFGFGYALVPLYNVFCEITGLNGKTGRLSPEAASVMIEDTSRLITVEFVTSVNSGFPWQFRPLITSMKVHPGVETTVEFEVISQSTDITTGQAVPSVAPSEAARYFSKTECFCFTEQALLAGESKRMPVRFVVNPKLPGHIDTLTLAYTFFRSVEHVTATQEPRNSGPNS